jgi:hypothetical protein
MSTITDILDRLSGVAIVKERLLETNRNVDRALTWLFDHEKRLLRIEAGGHAVEPPPKPPTRRLPRK